MKNFLLSISVVAALSTAANAQETYNYFDPADCDANGWLWFDTQEKLEKYCGFTDEFKIQLLSAAYENGDGEYAECELDAEIKGYNAEGEQGVEGTKTGAIILPRASSIMAQNGGGIMMWPPDCAEFSVYLSSEASLKSMVLYGGKGHIERVDFAVIASGVPPFKPLSKQCQMTWSNLQDEVHGTSGMTLNSKEKVTAAVVDDITSPVLIQGIKLFTYTQTEYPENGAGVEDIIGDDANAPVEYFNLQGLKVNGDEPGIYIRRQGAKTSKVLVK